MGPCCDEYESIGQAHDNWQESLFVHQQIGFPRPTHCHLLLAAVMGWSSTTASMRILPMSLLLLLLPPVGLAGQTTSSYYSYLPQVSLTIRNTARLTRKQEPKCSFRHVNTPQVAKLITVYDVSDKYFAANKCPPCFNCMLPAFTCGQYGECSEYDGQCKCPSGWAGIDCLTPRMNTPCYCGGPRLI